MIGTIPWPETTRSDRVPPMGGHVYVTVIGYGKRIVPAAAPCSFTRESDGTVVIRRGTLHRRLTVDDVAAPKLDPACKTADIIAGPTFEDWCLDAGIYVTPFPVGWTVEVTGDVVPAFYFVGSTQDAVFVETARNIPTADQLVAAHESVIERGTAAFPWAEVSYAHQGTTWIQRRTIVGESSTPRGMVVAQAPSAAFAAARALHQAIVDDIVFRPA